MRRLSAFFFAIPVLLVVALGGASYSSAHAQATPHRLALEGQSQTEDLSAALEHLIAPAAGDFPDVAAVGFADAWRASGESTLNIGYQPAGAWVRFAVAHPGPEPVARLLMIDWGFDRVEARVLDKASGQWSPPVLGGNSLAPAQRNVAAPFLALPLLLPAGESEVYIHLQSTQRMALPARLIEPQVLKKEERRDSLLMGAFFGAMLVMFLYNASLCIFTRDRSYLFYTSYLFASAFYVASQFGYGAFYLWADWQWLAPRSGTLSVSLAFLTSALFIRQFLGLTDHRGWLLRFNNIFIVYWSLAGLLVIGNPTAIRFLYIENMGAVFCLVFLATSFVLWRRGNRSAGYLLLAWSWLLGTTLWILLAIEGILPMGAYVRLAQLLGFVIEFLLLSIALAERINRERASRLHAQSELLTVQQQAQTQLEQRVALRTHQLEQANRELLRLSSTDSLTGLGNRRELDQRFSACIERGRRGGDYLAFLMIDIDHFKRINDRYGHGVGDECLALLGQTLAAFSRRDSEFAARLGGEEFAAVFSGLRPEQALAVAEQIRQAVAALQVEGLGEIVNFTVSIGVAVWIPLVADSRITYANAADQALYQAKAQGRNQVSLAKRV
nr:MULTISPECIES: diguanylate cyclase [unclassified Pseudomonas]